MDFSRRSWVALVLLICALDAARAAATPSTTRRLLGKDDDDDDSGSSAPSCSVGDGCKDYCEGWHAKKPLFWITSCPAKDKKKNGECDDLKCVHTSESKADVDGCYCCCGDEPAKDAVYHGPDKGYDSKYLDKVNYYEAEGKDNGCEVGNSCQDYCEGWHSNKQLFFITTCPIYQKASGQCGGMQCVHTSESEADTKGCYCCCGDTAVEGAFYDGPQKNVITGDEVAPPAVPPQGTCEPDGNQLGLMAGSAACMNLAVECHNPENLAEPFDNSAQLAWAAVNKETCSDSLKGFCMVAGKQYPGQQEPGCLGALQNGFQRCSPEIAQDLYLKMLSYFCGF